MPTILSDFIFCTKDAQEVLRAYYLERYVLNYVCNLIWIYNNQKLLNYGYNLVISGYLFLKCQPPIACYSSSHAL